MKTNNVLKQLEEYCKENNMLLTSSSFRRGCYAIVIHDSTQSGNTVIEGGVLCHRLSGYYTPKELMIWIDGYNAGTQIKNLK